MADEIESFKKWKNKKQNRKPNKFQRGKKFPKRKWMEEVDQIKALKDSYEQFDVTKAETFSDFPLSDKTKSGLEKAGYGVPTAIQKASIITALKGQDVLGAAKTGSGKTLAFLIPVMECLFRERWSAFAGPGALIISPTRELAYQTFEVLKKVGCFHDFSAGLVIGGKDVKSEATHMSRTNILICTPGRLLQHMDETSYFDVSNLQMLVLDEADRILDLGFKATLNAVLENIPQEKQTLLFSATQTKSVKDLARLSLKDPAYIAVHEKSKSSTPSRLNQKYIICKLQDKINVLFSFVKTHLKTKTLVFISSCKQVQYYYAAFCKLRPGVPVMMLHGKMKQQNRMEVYDEFCRKKFALLFCTDIAARGLDFPSIDWVFQLDCPEDADTYIHRVGRTARYHGNGNALLVLMESEEKAMLEQLEAKKVPVTKTDVNSSKFFTVNSRLESYCAESMELKERAQKCFVSYIRSVFLMKNKSVFSVQSLPLAEYAKSLGLAVTPRVRFLQRNQAKATAKPIVDINHNLKDNENWNAPGFSGGGGEEDDIGDMFSVKRKDIFNLDAKEQEDIVNEGDPEEESGKKKKILTKAAAAKRLLKKKYKCNQKITFDDEGQLAEAWPPMDPKEYKAMEVEKSETSGGIDIEMAKSEMEVRDRIDLQRHRQKIKERHREKRQKEKEKRRKLQAKKDGRQHGNEEEVVAYLGTPDEDDVSDDSEGVASGSWRESREKRHFSDSESEDFSDDDYEPAKKRKLGRTGKNADMSPDLAAGEELSLVDEENLALHLLGKS